MQFLRNTQESLSVRKPSWSPTTDFPLIHIAANQELLH